MTKILTAILILAGITLVILFRHGIIQFNPDDSNTENQTTLTSRTLPTPTPKPTRTPSNAISNLDILTANLTPDPTPALLPTPTVAPIPQPTIQPTPTLTPLQIFALLDENKITINEAKTLLGDQTTTPGNTSTPNPNSTTIPTSTPLFIERGSELWIKELENKIHILINIERQNVSINSLQIDFKLAEVARTHSQDLSDNDYFSHTSLTGQSPSDRAATANYECNKNYGTYQTRGIGENLAQTWLYSSTNYKNGVPTTRNYMTLEQISEQIVKGWMDSPPHHKNIIKPEYDKEGIAVIISNEEKVFITQNFC